MEQWDPYSDRHQQNEEALTDYQGKLIETEYWDKFLLPEDSGEVETVTIESVKKMMEELDDRSPMYTANVPALMEEGLSVKAPLSQEEVTKIGFCNSTYISREAVDSFSNVNPLLDQSVLSSRAAALHVF